MTYCVVCTLVQYFREVVNGEIRLKFFSDCFSLLIIRQSISSIKCVFFSFFIMFHVFILLLDPALKFTTGHFFYCCRWPAYADTFQVSDKRNALYTAFS